MKSTYRPVGALEPSELARDQNMDSNSQTVAGFLEIAIAQLRHAFASWNSKLQASNILTLRYSKALVTSGFGRLM
jgi:hypothetical protein